MNIRWKQMIAALLIAVGVLGAAAGVAGAAQAVNDQTETYIEMENGIPANSEGNSVVPGEEYVDEAYTDEAVALNRVAEGVTQENLEAAAAETSNQVAPSDPAKPQERNQNTTVQQPENAKQESGLKITQTLRRYAKNQGNAISVFHITGVDTEYDKYVALEFTQAGAKTITVADVPKGKTVTVTEVYSGACYSVRENKTQNVKIPEEGAASLSFTNDYNGNKNGGAGIVNHFEYAEGTNGTGAWRWTPKSASATPGTAAAKTGK